jgi:hypothetical protein
MVPGARFVVHREDRVKVTDPVAIIEAAYRLEGTDATWLKELARSATLALAGERGAFAYLYDASGGDWVNILGVEMHEFPGEFVQELFNQPDVGRDVGVALAKLMTDVQFATYRNAIGHLHPVFSELLTRFVFEDLICINARDPTARGCVMCLPDRGKKRSQRTIRVYHRLAAHISAGFRLRRELATVVEQGVDVTSHAEAVLSPSGRVEHAVGAAEPRPAREALQDALVRIEAARSRRSDPQDSVELWRALVSGRWSVVEHFERDGKRYYLAHKNDPELAPDLALTQRERQVLGYAELGHSDKLIAYSLGLSRSTVATLLARARRKLGPGVALIPPSSAPT